MNEAQAQLLFWSGMGCLPLSLILFLIGFQKKEKGTKRILVFTGSVSLLHFIWYFRTLGVGLADKTGNIEYPKWWLHILIGVAIGGILAFLSTKQNTTEPASGINS
ncbi:MAG: hypothetical protein AAF065_09070 [Verrucomicrobiota bacterium]